MCAQLSPIPIQVERTKGRPIASGEISTPQAIALLGGLLSVSLGILLQLNWLRLVPPLVSSLVKPSNKFPSSVAVGASSMLLVIAYPLAKRYTYWPQVILGEFSLPPAPPPPPLLCLLHCCDCPFSVVCTVVVLSITSYSHIS